MRKGDILVQNCPARYVAVVRSPEHLMNRLRQLRKERYEQDRLNPTGQRAKPGQRAAILNKTRSRCHICGGAIQPGSYWEADHVFPAAAGGDGQIDNFLAAHGLCNTAKWDHRGEEFQWILKIGVWAKRQMESNTDPGPTILKLFGEHERNRAKRQKANRTEVHPSQIEQQ